MKTSNYSRILVFLGLILGFSLFFPAKQSFAEDEDCTKRTFSQYIKNECNYTKYWPIKTMSSSNVTKLKTISLGPDHTQGSTVTKDYIVYSSHTNAREEAGEENYLIVLDRTYKKIAKFSSKEWGHIHTIWNNPSTNYIRVDPKRGNDSLDKCYDLTNVKSKGLVSVPCSETGIKVPTQYGKNGLVYQNEATYGGYIYTETWDAGTVSWLDTYYRHSSEGMHYTRNSNSIIIRDGSGKIVQVLYFPKSFVAGEFEGMSFDANGDLIISVFVSGTSNNNIVFYKVAEKDHLPVKTESAEPKAPKADDSKKSDTEKKASDDLITMKTLSVNFSQAVNKLIEDGSLKESDIKANNALVKSLAASFASSVVKFSENASLTSEQIALSAEIFNSVGTSFETAFDSLSSNNLTNKSEGILKDKKQLVDSLNSSLSEAITALQNSNIPAVAYSGFASTAGTAIASAYRSAIAALYSIPNNPTEDLGSGIAQNDIAQNDTTQDPEPTAEEIRSAIYSSLVSSSVSNLSDIIDRASTSTYAEALNKPPKGVDYNDTALFVKMVGILSNIDGEKLSSAINGIEDIHTKEKFSQTLETIKKAGKTIVDFSTTAIEEANNAKNSNAANNTSSDWINGASNSLSGSSSYSSSSSSSASSASICSDPTVPDVVKRSSGCDDANIDNSFNRIMNAAISVIGIVAVVFIIKGGADYMTASGDPSKIKKAKTTILYACIGLAFVILSAAIVNFIVGKL